MTLKFVLIGNYLRDQQESMERFALMLAEALRVRGHDVAIWRPLEIFGRLGRHAHQGLGKWLGYFDKWILTAVLFWLRQWTVRIQGGEVRFHVCDHSNAPYLALFPAEQSGITCHDVLAIRGALGDESVFCPASRIGIHLQHWILKNLLNARRLAAVSQATMDDLKKLQDLSHVSSRLNRHKCRREVIYNAFNNTFSPMVSEEAHDQLQRVGLTIAEPFLLHVGSDLPRKNRSLLLRLAEAMGKDWKGRIVLAGQAAGIELQKLIDVSPLRARITIVEHPSHELLVALYSRCHVFVFPSFSEGFGWPLIEAQVCGAPVIASARAPMPEVSGGAALHADPNDVAGFVDALLRLDDVSYRRGLIARGLENASRFSNESMGKAYEALYAEV